MTELPLYLAGPGYGDTGTEEGLPLPEGAPPPRTIRDLARFPEEGDVPGWVLVTEAVPPEVLMGLLLRLARAPGPWSPLLVRKDGIIPLSPGWPHPPDRVAQGMTTGGSTAGVLSFRLAMEDLARVRHDINNPLTAALAEVQLSLLDVEPGSEIDGSLKVVEDQIRRIRDLVAELTHYRVPRP